MVTVQVEITIRKGLSEWAPIVRLLPETLIPQGKEATKTTQRQRNAQNQGREDVEMGDSVLTRHYQVNWKIQIGKAAGRP